MNLRRFFVGALLVFVSIGPLRAESETQYLEEKPNILLLFVDDLGWSDLGFRNSRYETPNIDALSREGFSFTQAYSPSPTCSPSRAALLTGKHPARLKLVRHIAHDRNQGFDASGRPDRKFSLWETDPAQMPSANWLDLEHVTYAEALREKGYHNEFIGKWHLGHEPYYPVHQGFDRQIGTSNGGQPRSYYPQYFRDPNILETEDNRYLTDRLTDAAVSFIEEYSEDKPFTLSFWYYAVHTPHQGRSDLVRHFEEKGLSGRQAHFAAMVKSVDDSVGRIRNALKAKGIDKNTVIIFLSDQGGFFESDSLRGKKTEDTLFEGGARIPMIFYGDSFAGNGVENDSPVQLLDIFPTLIEIVGGNPEEYPDLDGVSLLGTLATNEPLGRSEPIYGYRAYEDLYASVRDSDWKLLAYRSGKTELYRDVGDTREEQDLSKAHPGITENLKEQLMQWEKKMGVAEYSGIQ